jgi:hypothetical protein
MAVAAWISGSLGAVCAVIGILSATGAIAFLEDLPAGFSPLFWLVLGGLFILGSIALAVGRNSYE